MKVTLIPVVIGALEKICKSTGRGLEELEIGRAENIQTIVNICKSPEKTI